MLPVFVVLFLVGCSRVHSKTMPPALRFGQTRNDYVQLPEGIMDSSTSRFSLFAWVRKRYRARAPVLFSYYPDSEDIILGSDGSQFMVVQDGTGFRQWLSDLQDGEWFHLGMTWSTGDYTLRAYLNGERIGYVVETHRRELKTGGRACIGNFAGGQSISDIFGGDLYKFNIYRRVLERDEIRVLASDMCSSAEDSLAASMILTWEDVLQNERTGNVTEIYTNCTETQQRPRLIEEQLKNIEKELEITRQDLKGTSKDHEITKQDLESTRQDFTESKTELKERLEEMTRNLNNKEVELNSIRQHLKDTRKDINITKQDLKSTRKDFTESKTEVKERLKEITRNLNNKEVELNSTRKDLSWRLEEFVTNQKRNERLYLILTIVFGALSAVLIILLTTLLVRRVPGNRTD